MSDQEDTRRGRKGEAAFRTISEVAQDLDIPQHVLRFWETKFTQVRPLKRGGGRRYYRPEDVALLRRIQTLLYEDGLTIKGVQKLFKEAGVKAVLEGNGVSPTVSDAEGGAQTLDAAEVQQVLDRLVATRDKLQAALQT